MTPVQKLAAMLLIIVVAMAASAGFTWQVQDWRMGKKMAERIAEQGARHQKELDAITGEAWRQQKAELDKRLATEQQLAKQDQQHTKELSDAKTSHARLRDRLATSDLRLSVLLDATDTASGCNVPTAAGSVSVVHATRRAQLDPAHAQRIVSITNEGDNGLIALRACQSYASRISEIMTKH